MKTILITMFIFFILPAYSIAADSNTLTQFEIVDQSSDFQSTMPAPMFVLAFSHRPEFQNHYSASSGNLLIFFQNTRCRSDVKKAGNPTSLKGVKNYSLREMEDGSLQLTFKLTRKLYPIIEWIDRSSMLNIRLSNSEAPPVTAPVKSSEITGDHLTSLATLTVKNMEVREILKLLLPGNYTISIPDELNRRVTLNLKNRPIRVILNEIARKLEAAILVKDNRIEFTSDGIAALISNRQVIEKLRFRETPLKKILETVASLSQVNLIIHKSAARTVRNRVNFFVHKLDHQSIFRQLLKVHNLESLFIQPNSLMIMSKKSYLTRQREAFRIFHLENSRAKETALEINKLFLSNELTPKISINTKKNALEVLAPPTLMEAIENRIDEVERENPPQRTENIFIENLRINEIRHFLGKHNLVEFLKSYLDQSEQPAKLVQNSKNRVILIRGTPSQIRKTRELIKKADHLKPQVQFTIKAFSFHSRQPELYEKLKREFCVAKESDKTVMTLPNAEIGDFIHYLNANRESIIEPITENSIRIIDGETGKIQVERSAIDSERESLITIEISPTIHKKEISIALDLTSSSKYSPESEHKQMEQNPDKKLRVKTLCTLLQNESLLVDGLSTITKTSKINRWPLFGYLPIVGHLFRQRVNREFHHRQFILITPHTVTRTEPDNLN